MLRLASLALVLPLVACAAEAPDGGGGGGGGGGGDSVDAAVGNPTACTVPATFGDRGMYQGTATLAKSAMNPALYAIIVRLKLDNATTFDGLTLELLTGYAPFGTQAAPTPIVTGTYPLTGEQTQYKTCGTCVTVLSDIDSTAMRAGPAFLATGGSVNVTQAGTAVGQPFAVTLSNVTLQEVTIAQDDTSTAVTGGCTTRIDNATFTGTLAAPPAARVAGAPGLRGALSVGGF